MSSSRWHLPVCFVLPLVCLGFQYDPLPSGNLLQNPWFRVDCESSLAGWSVDVTPDGLSWGGSDKTQNPSDENCLGDWTGFAARWADQNSKGVSFSPNQDARLWQVVGPVDASATTLQFHFLMVFHRMNTFRAEIFGGDGPDGPWTSVWIPFEGQWLAKGGANEPFNGTCPGGLQDRDCLWDKVTEADLGALEPLSREIAAGYPYYKVEFLGNYPEPDASPTGDVGGKIVRVYFAVGDGPAGATSGDSTGGTGDGSSGTGEPTGGGDSAGGTGEPTGGEASDTGTSNTDSGASDSASGGEGVGEQGCACDVREEGLIAPLVLAFAGLTRRRRSPMKRARPPRSRSSHSAPKR